MEYSEAFIKGLEDGVDSLWRSVEAMPEDKLDWKPSETARSTREILGEVATITGQTAQAMIDVKFDMTGEGGGEKPTDLVELEKVHREGVELYKKAIKGFPEAELATEMDLPWGKMSWLDVITYVYWNTEYHWGQINYIQTMYGDQEMP